ncbi:MAG: type II toxin-antitoxin system PemK/MazF family toxin [Parcubacteria group bacterium]|nr:type II toxin-antitoxin system PemK/MazF family toxin [Parcubacteria group bacterium]
MKKDFDNWHKEKSNLHQEKIRPFFHEREIWFASVGINIGFEQDGRGDQFLRPVIILKKFNNEVLWGIPLTKNQKKGEYYFQFKFLSEEKMSTAILSQIRLIDSKRLQYKIGDVKEDNFIELKRKIMQLLA